MGSHTVASRGELWSEARGSSVCVCGSQLYCFFFSSRRRHTRCSRDWSSDVCSSDLVQTNCDVVFDFDWRSVIGHNQPKFPGLHDLSQAIAQFAKICGKAPLLLLSDKADVAFDELITDSTYVAVVHIKDFLACTTEHDRSALFFLSA